MNRIVLRDITHVYRFGISVGSWERDMPAEDNFIAYKLYGYTEHESGGSLYPFSKDMVMVANSRDAYRVTRHEFAAEGRRGGCIAVHFTTAAPFGMHLAVYDCAACPQLRSEFFRILDSWNQYEADGSDASKYLCAAHFFSIISLLLALIDGRGEVRRKNQKIAEAKAYLDRNYADSTLSIADAAESAGLSQRRFGELFLEQYRETPGRYLTSLRVNAAAELLKDGSLTISEISSLTGYASANYFIRVFRREMNVSPNAYRAHMRMID